MKRIAVTGASGVGKTVFAKRLASALNLPCIEEIARRVCAEMGYQRIGEIPDQEGFKNKVLEEQIAAENESAEFVSDRSAIDCWILWQRWNICSAMTYDSEALYEKVRAHAKSYTHIIYIPPLFTPSEDGFRWIEPDYIKQIDRITRTTLYDLDLLKRSYTIDTDNLENRIQNVLRWLDSENCT